MQRRLAAIMVADVVGSSRLIEADEAAALSSMRERWSEIVEPLVTEHSGRIVKFMGDGVLAEFASAVNAVKCGLAVQERMAKANEGVAEDRRIVLRIGINVGDVVGEESDIFGDGVNVAARIEAMAEPGSLCITGGVQDAIRGKIDAATEDLGERTLKNLERPVRLWRVRTSTATCSTTRREIVRGHEKPSIAVLPFTNMSGDPEQEYFADGMAEEIITALSRFSGLFVVARNSTFTYKGRSVDVREIGQQLNVRYVLEGSVRKSGDRLRITGQLIDVSTGNHLWAERFDGTLHDVFDLQDRVTAKVVGAIAPKLEQAEIERVRRKPTESLAAYDHYLRGVERIHRWTREANEEALAHLYKAIELDPDFAAAWGMAARCYSQRKAGGWSVDSAAERRETERLVSHAMSLGSDDALALSTAGIAMGFVVEDLDTAQELTDRALRLNPNLIWALYAGGWVKTWAGCPAEAAERLTKAIELSPNDPQLFSMQDALATALFLLDRYEESYAMARASTRQKRDYALPLVVAAATASLIDREQDAHRHLEEALRALPELKVSRIAELIPEVRKSNKLETLVQIMRRLGLPE